MTSGGAFGPDPPDTNQPRPYVGDGPNSNGGSAEPRPPVFEESRPRPYMLTGGRARPIDSTLELEAQVLTTRVGRSALERHAFEHRHILIVCTEPVAVAEVAARLGLHLAVARVLVADLLALGHLSVRRPHSDQRRNVDVIERVIRGLEAIP